MPAPALKFESILAQDPYSGVSPRVRLAAKLYATGATKTKAEASRLAGLNPNTLTVLSGRYGNPKVRMLLQDLERKIEAGTIETAQALQVLSKRAVLKMAQLMEYSDRQDIQLKAATELADRCPDTQKTQQIQATTFTLGSDDAREIAKALVESAQARDRFAHVARDGLVEVDVDQPPAVLPPGGDNGSR